MIYPICPFCGGKCRAFGGENGDPYNKGKAESYVCGFCGRSLPLFPISLDNADLTKLSRGQQGSKDKIIQEELKAAELYETAMRYVTELDFEKAMDPMLESARLGNTVAMAEVGYAIAYGLTCRGDMSLALRYLRSSAELGNDYACYVLWEMHDDGFSEISTEEAEKWCNEAAKRGSVKALARKEEGFDSFYRAADQA